MKILILLFSLLIASPCFALSGAIQAVVGVTSTGGGQAAAYFGNNVTSGSSSTCNSCTAYNGTAVFTCPGTGTRTIDELSVYAKSAGGTPAEIRMAVGTTDSPSTILFQWNDGVSVTSTTASWVSQPGWTGTPQCTGGTNYTIFVAIAASADVLTYWDSVGYTTNDYKYDIDGSDHVTSGFGETHSTTGSDAEARIAARAHVTATP